MSSHRTNEYLQSVYKSFRYLRSVLYEHKYVKLSRQLTPTGKKVTVILYFCIKGAAVIVSSTLHTHTKYFLILLEQ